MAALPTGRRRTTDAAPHSAAALDDGADDAEPETGPLRRCIVTRTRLEKERMIRFVVGPDRTLVPDLAARLPGRGIWLSARGDVIETARARGAFAKAARCPVIVRSDLTLVLQAALVRRISELLGLARRAGQAVAGFQKAREWLQAGRAALVVQASDGSIEERARFIGGRASVPVVTPLPASALGAIFGRDHAVHVAIAAGRLAEALLNETERLAGIAGDASAAPVGGATVGAAATPDKGGDMREMRPPSGTAGRGEVQETGG